MNNPFGLEKSIPRAVNMLQNMVNPEKITPDSAIPLTLLRHCEGIAFIRIFKAGLFMIGGNLGGGCVIAKVKDPDAELGYRWSAPVAVQCGGLGGGFVFGGEQIDSIIILNTVSAVRAFTGKGQITFGGNVSLAVGPVGRDIEAHVGASSNKEIVAAYSYSQAKGAYIGGTLEGAILIARDEENKKFYENPQASAEGLLLGAIRPPFKAQALEGELNMALLRKGPYSKIKDKASMTDLASSGRDLVKQGLSSGSFDDLPPGWEVATAPDGKIYYYNNDTKVTQWEKPVKSSPLPPPTSSPAYITPITSASSIAKPAPVPIPPRPSAAAVRNPTFPALYDYDATQADELSIRTGDRVEIIEKIDANWWKGKLNGKVGLVPATYLKQ
jgi:lipid-binding SYLF domain-containing protein